MATYANNSTKEMFIVLSIEKNLITVQMSASGKTLELLPGSKVKLTDLKIGGKYEGYVQGNKLNFVWVNDLNKQQPVPEPKQEPAQPFKSVSDEVVALTLTRQQAYELEKTLDNIVSLTYDKELKFLEVGSPVYALKYQEVREKIFMPIIKQLEQHRGLK